MNSETERLTLNLVHFDDAQDIFVNFTHEVNVYMQPEVPQQLSDTLSYIKLSMAEHELHLTSLYVIRTKQDAEFIGIVSLHHLNHEVPEIGIWTKKGSHGHHYGREAVGGVIEIAKQRGFQKLVYPVDWRNEPSKKIPQFYGGVVIEQDKKLVTDEGRILELMVYEITL